MGEDTPGFGKKKKKVLFSRTCLEKIPESTKNETTTPHGIQPKIARSAFCLYPNQRLQIPNHIVFATSKSIINWLYFISSVAPGVHFF